MPEKQKGLLKSSLLVGVMTMISRLLGLLRDVVFAVYLGDKPGADAFFVAFKVPQFLRRLFAEGAFSQAFVPVLSEYQTTRSRVEVKRLIDRVAGVLGLVVFLVCFVVVLASPWFTILVAPGFYLGDDPEKYQLTSEMIRITFPYLFLITMTGFAGAVLNTYNQFAVPAFTPVFLNICLIVSAVFVSPYFEQPVMAIAWGVLMAGIIQLLFQMPFLLRLQLMPTPIVDFSHPGVKRIMTLMLPALFGVSVSQLNLMLDTILASFLPTGSVSWLYFSDRISELPLGVFGIAIATVILPNLSRKHAANDPVRFSATVDWALRLVLLISIPATTALLVLALPILKTLFMYGDNFTLFTAQMSAFSLQAYALGLLAFMSIKILATGFYARQDMKTPVAIGVKAMIVNSVLNVVFIFPMHHFWQLGHVGLALATTIA
ncbi:MAG: murein biosynthesis integral membrane protein MurJ, partial [Pseudomonadales bacterium]|nr:murein biosynthesis integral membrane protein MurJ [Pseudomonadales bacterium]